MSVTPGLLYVTMQPKEGLSDAQFHDWYNNEHGPARLRFSFIPNGFRYNATDLGGAGKDKPGWLALYDVTNTKDLNKEAYTSLRTDAVKSQREKDTMKQVAVDRRIFDLIESWQSMQYRSLEGLGTDADGTVLVTVSITLNSDYTQDELDRWYHQEHIRMLAKVPGWRRSRRFKTSPIGGKEEVEYLALHEYAPENGLGGPAFEAATTTPWANDILQRVSKEKHRRVWSLQYTFGPAPRDLNSVAASNAVSFTSPNGKLQTRAASEGGPLIESYVTTEDGVELPYRLEGSPEPEAPMILLSNSILTEWNIWDEFVTNLLSQPGNDKYRILRYHTRGRKNDSGQEDVDLKVLAGDIITLLDALRVPKAAALIGVSLGGATVLNAALQYPKRVECFISCDTNAKSPEANSKLWGDRIAVAEKQGARDPNGEAVVGEELAEATVRRWFIDQSYDGGEIESRINQVKGQVSSNSLDGFKRSVQALYNYDLTAQMRHCEVKGAFYVGSGDGKLPSAMKDMATALGDGGAEYAVINRAGHLPMVEKPREFADLVSTFLDGSTPI